MQCLIPSRSFRRTISRRNSDKGSTCRGLFRGDPARATETVKAHYDRLTDLPLKKKSLCLEPGIRLLVSLRRTGLKELGVKQHRTPTLLDSVALQREARGQLSKGLLTQVKNKNPTWEACCAKRPLFSRPGDWLSTILPPCSVEGGRWQVTDRVS